MSHSGVIADLLVALTSALQFGNVGQVDRLVRASRSTADRWVKAAVWSGSVRVSVARWC